MSASVPKSIFELGLEDLRLKPRLGAQEGVSFFVKLDNSYHLNLV